MGIVSIVELVTLLFKDATAYQCCRFIFPFCIYFITGRKLPPLFNPYDKCVYYFVHII